MLKKNPITLFGSFQSFQPEAFFIRKYVEGLIRSGYRVNIREKKGKDHDSDFPIKKPFTDIIVIKTPPDGIEIGFVEPKDFPKVKGGKKGIFFFVEAVPAPRTWIDGANKHFDFCVVPSKFVKTIAERSGISIPIEIIPYTPAEHKETKPRADGIFRFKSIATPDKRRNIPFMIHAFMELFFENENLELVIKTFPNSKHGKVRHWEEDVEELKNNYGMYGNVKIVDEVYNDDQMIGFLDDADCYIQVSSAEGMGLFIFEAVKRGIPVIATDYGAHTDYLKGSYVPVEYEMDWVKGHYHGKEDFPALVAKPGWESYKKALSEMYNNYLKTKK